MQELRIYKTPCLPPCGGEVHYWSFSDCSYDSGSGIDCQKCGREYTRDEWGKIAAEELGPELEKQKKKEERQREKEKRNEVARKRALAKLTRKEKVLLGLPKQAPA